MASGRLQNVLGQVRRLFAAEVGERQADRGLLERFVARRDEEAFAALVERHGPMVHAVCRRVLWQQQDAEDACQAAFLVLARKAGTIRQGASLGSWLHGVAYRVAGRLRRDRARRQGRERPLQDVAGADTTGEVTWREALAVLDEELRRLPEKYRAPLVLCCLEGRARDEAAVELGLSAGALKGRLERGRERLRTRLAQRGLSLPAALLAALLSEGPGSAALPVALASATVRAALLVTTEEAVSVPAEVMALTRGTLRAMSAARVKRAACVLLALSLAIAGGVLFVQRMAPPEPQPQPQAQRPAPDADTVRAERRQLQGDWELVRTESDGRILEEEDNTTGKCVIAGDRIDLRPRIQEKLEENAPWKVQFDRERVTGTYTPAVAVSPRRLTITGDWLGPRGQKKATFQALYHLDGDTLKILLPVLGAEPPGDFRTVLDSGQHLFVFRRMPADRQKLLGSWSLVKTEENGKDVTDPNMVGACWFTDDGRMTLLPRVRVLRRGPKEQRTEQLEDMGGTYRLETAKRPHRLVVKGDWGTAPKTFSGTIVIPYELTGATLKLQLFPADQGPPATAGGGARPRLLTFRRDPPPEQPAPKAGPIQDQAPPPEPAKPAPARKVDSVKPPPGWREQAVFPAPAGPNGGQGVLLYTSFRVSPKGDLLGFPGGIIDLETGANLMYRGDGRGMQWCMSVWFTPGGRPVGLEVKSEPQKGTGRCTLSDCITGRERTPLDGPGGPARAALSPDGRLLALSGGGAVLLWDATTGRRLGALAGPLETDIEWLEFSPDGKMVFAAGNGPWLYGATERHAYLKLWEVASRRERAARKEPTVLEAASGDTGWGMVTLFSPDGKRVALPCRPFRGGPPTTGLRLWDTATLKDLGAVKQAPQHSLRNFAFSPDGNSVALIQAGPPAPGQAATPLPLTIVDLATGREVARVAPPLCGFAAVAYAPDGSRMIAQDNQGTLRVWARQPAR